MHSPASHNRILVRVMRAFIRLAGRSIQPRQTTIRSMANKGTFERTLTTFRNWIQFEPDAAFPAQAHRYHLYISLACPWASRCLAMLHLKGLEDVVGVSIVHPVFQRTRPDDADDSHVGWAFVDPIETPTLPGPTGLGAYSSAGSTPDVVNNARFARDLYDMCTSDNVRYSVPILWDKTKQTIVSNESSDIIRMFNSAFRDIVSSTTDFYPNQLREEIDKINAWIYEDINHGVYKCGFAHTQEAYDAAVSKLLEALDRVEAILGRQRFLVGSSFTEADLRLFMTLVRFDEVYYVHFKTCKKRIADYPNLSNYMRDIYQHPKIRPTVNFEHIRLHYYASHTFLGLNPHGIVPVAPETALNAENDRDRFPATNWP